MFISELSFCSCGHLQWLFQCLDNFFSFTSSCLFGSYINRKLSSLCRWTYHFSEQKYQNNNLCCLGSIRDTWYLQYFFQYMDNCFIIICSLWNSSHNNWQSLYLCRWYYRIGRSYLNCWQNYWMFSKGSLSTVDIYDASSNAWQTSSLSQDRYNLVATTTGNLALFAGGFTGGVSYKANKNIN